MMTSTSTPSDCEPNDYNSNSNSNNTSTTTILANPGIIDRLEQDIADYLSPFGFHLERQQQDQDDDERSGNCSKCKAVLTIPRLPYSYTKFRFNDGASTTTTETGVPIPIGTLHLHIHQESLLSTVGPLLRTFLRLSPSHISPRRLRAIIHCDHFILDALQKLHKMNSKQRCHQLNRQEELSARKMAHHIHMLVRNSMGSALCLELVVVLPCYWRRKVIMQKDVDNGDKNATDDTELSKVPISVETVQLAMQNNPDACYYPSVQLVKATTNNEEEQQPKNTSNSNSDDNHPASIHLNVDTRMCTVRHQPLIFQWLHSLTYHSQSSFNNEEGVVEECKHDDITTTDECDDKYSN